jgi:hypothetical protein
MMVAKKISIDNSPIISTHPVRSGCLLRQLHPEPIEGFKYFRTAFVFKQSAFYFSKYATHKYFLRLTLSVDREEIFGNDEFGVPTSAVGSNNTAERA